MPFTPITSSDVNPQGSGFTPLSASDVLNGNNAAQDATPPTPPQPDLGDKVASDIKQSGSNIADIVQDPNGGNALTKTGKVLGEAANAVAAPAVEGIKSVIGLLPDALTKNFFGTPEEKAAQAPANTVDKAIYNWSVQHPAAYNKLKNTLQAIAGTGAAAGIATGAVEGAGAAADAPSLAETAGDIKNTVAKPITAVKEAVAPSLTPEEQVGKIIQGKTTDIPAAQRTFDALPQDSKAIAKMSPSDISNSIQDNIIQKNLDSVGEKFSGDTNPHTLDYFDQTVGTGKSAVTTNYVQQGIDQLKEFYAKTNDAQGLSDVKALEEKANTEGLTSGDLNQLAKEHGTTIKAFNANGEAASGLSSC
jgi:NAD(P)H-hydrate repair Nnr-like enzyme with NAD(P)H-hydrate dehydratase domain